MSNGTGEESKRLKANIQKYFSVFPGAAGAAAQQFGTDSVSPGV